MKSPTITALDHNATAFLLIGLLIVIAPHLLQLPIWLSAAVIIIGLWRWRLSNLGWKLPNTPLRVSITIVALISIFAQYGSVAGREAGVALLIAMAALKLLELRERRDVLVLIFLSYFILITHFLYSQEIPIAIYVFASCWALITLHIHLSYISPPSLKVCAKQSAALLIQALPLMLILFILFPRLPGPIWSLPKDAYSGMTGLSDSMSPGNISQLTRSDEVAFRASFYQDVPDKSELYWRGPVFSKTDGRTWSADFSRSLSKWETPQFNNSESMYSYAVTLEPHNRKWLFALDLPAITTEHGELKEDYHIVTTRPVRQRMRYDMVSYSRYNTGDLSPELRILNLQLPEGRNPQTHALALQFKNQTNSDAQLVQRALRMFREEQFTYTLSPPLLTTDDPVDEFLFMSLRGFCEHFSSSFVTLMRAAGIPARVVTGYQGGEMNPVGNYMIVRQKDAHAWAEVWLQGQGWVRVDPTAAVAPERIESSIDTATSQGSPVIRFRPAEMRGLTKFVARLNLQIDAINNSWNQFVLGYGPEQQAAFLRSFGLDIRSWKQLAMTLITTVIIIVVLTSIYILSHRNKGIDAIQRIFLRFCEKASKTGLTRHDNETASAYALRLIDSFPQYSNQINQITALYSQLRYSPGSNHAQTREFRRLVRSFKV